MNVLEQLVARAKRRPACVVLPESEDPRILRAASNAARDGIANVVLLGQEAAIETHAKTEGIALDRIRIIDPSTSELRLDLAQALKARRPWTRMTDEELVREAQNPLHFGNLLVSTGHVDGSVAGAVHTSPDVMRSAIRIIGRATDSALLSSIFLMYFGKAHHPVQGGMIFADCALNIEPSEQQLTQIAINAAQNARFLLNEPPRIAMLSFSTMGSARHASSDKVVRAARRIKKRYPDLLIDEDMQLDAAVIPGVAARKAPDSTVQGHANVLIFPNLDAGNIGYKLTERFGGARAIGPLLQGLARPANDLSRGCDVEDIYYAIAVTSIQAWGTPAPL